MVPPQWNSSTAFLFIRQTISEWTTIVSPSMAHCWKVILGVMSLTGNRRPVFQTASNLGTFRHDNNMVIKIDVLILILCREIYNTALYLVLYLQD
jgi:hypothetical protein